MAKKIDALEHNRVPDHHVLDEDEAKEIMEEKGLDQKKLPSIKKSDPALNDLEVEVGDLVEITRESPTAGTHKYYRRVIKD